MADVRICNELTAAEAISIIVFGLSMFLELSSGAINCTDDVF